MPGFFRLAKMSDRARHEMPMDLLMRAFYKATIRKFSISHMNPPESMRKHADYNVREYVREITSRLMRMWEEENERAVSEEIRWDRRVESDLHSGLLDYKA